MDDPDITEPAEELLFADRTSDIYRPIVFNDIVIKSVDDHKHLGLA